MLPDEPSGDQSSTDQKDPYDRNRPVGGIDTGNIYIGRMLGPEPAHVPISVSFFEAR